MNSGHRKFSFPLLPLSLKISLLYCAIGFCWVLASDALWMALAQSSQMTRNMQLAKDLLFVTTTSFALWFTFSRIERSRSNLHKAKVESETRFLTALAGSLDAIYILDAARNENNDIVDFLFREVNAKAEHELQMKREELIGHGICELFPINRHDGYFDQYKAVLETGIALEREYIVPEGFAASGWYYHQVVPCGDGVAIFNRNITERKAVENRLRRLSLVAEKTSNMIIITDACGLTEWVNPAFLALTGYSFDELKGKKPGDILQGEGTDVETTQAIGTAIREGKSWQAELVNYKKNGERYWVFIKADPFFDEQGVLQGFIGVQKDITERKNLEHQVRERERELQLTLEAATDGIWKWNIAEDLLELSPQYYKMLGYEHEKLPRSLEQWKILLHPDDSEIAMNALHKYILKQSGEYRSQFRIRAQNGEYRWFESNARIVEYAPDGTPLRMIGNHRDITTEKEVAERLKISAQETANFRAALEQSAIVSVTDVRGKIVYANAQFVAISGYSLEELIGSNHNIVNSGVHEKEFFRQMWQTISAGTPWRGEICNRAKDGSLYWVETAINPMFDASGRIYQYLSVRYEITNRKRTENDLRILNEELEERILDRTRALQELNAEKDEILAIVSHDLKNPISAVHGLAEMMEQGYAEGEQVCHLSAQIMRIADRMLDLVKNLLDVHQLEQSGMQLTIVTFDIVSLVESIVWQYQPAAETKQITLHVQVENTESATDIKSPENTEHHLTYVSADEQALMQVLDNLISNAIKYSPHGKNVFVRVQSCQNTVRVEVQDEGPGLSEEDKQKLFGKFARLSAQPTGGEHSTGLGLSIVKKLVEAMNGRVWCESELGKGATFVVELPIPC